MADISRIRTVQLAQNLPLYIPQKPGTAQALPKTDNFLAQIPGPERWPDAFKVDSSRTFSSDTKKVLDRFFEKNGAVIKLVLEGDSQKGTQNIVEISKAVYQKLQGHPIRMTGKVSYVEFEFSAKDAPFKPNELVMRTPNQAYITVGDGYAREKLSNPVQIAITQKNWGAVDGYQVFLSFVLDADKLRSYQDKALALDFTPMSAIAKDLPERLGLAKLDDFLRLNGK